MFKFNPYNFTITIDEAIQPPGIPQNYIQVKNAAGQSVWAAPGSRMLNTQGRSPRVINKNAAGKTTTLNFAKTYASQQAPIQQNVRANILANQQANVQMTPSQRQAMMAAALAKRARQNKGTGAPPVIPPPPPPAGSGSPPPLPPPPTGTSTGVSDRQQRFMTGAKDVTDAISGMGNSWASRHPNRRQDRYGDPGQLLYGGIKAAVGMYNSMKTPGTPGSAATATTPAVAATPGKFDPRAGTRMSRAGVGALAGTLVAGPVGGLLGAGIGALTARRQPIPEERYYRVYKMISQHDHR